MKKLIIPLAIAAALALPATTHAEGDTTIAASVDCSTFAIDIEGLPANTRVTVQAGPEPPYIFVTDSGSVATTLHVGQPEQGIVFFAAIGIDTGLTGHPDYPFQQWIDCTSTVKVAVPQMDDPEPVKAGLVRSVHEAPTPIAHVEAVEAVEFGNYQLAPPEA